MTFEIKLKLRMDDYYDVTPESMEDYLFEAMDFGGSVSVDIESVVQVPDEEEEE